MGEHDSGCAQQRNETRRSGCGPVFAGKTMELLYFNSSFDWNEEFESYDWGSRASWDYPVFDWQEPGYINDFWYDANNSVGVAVGYMIYRHSCITGLPLLDADSKGWNTDGDLTLRDALVSAVRLYESVEEVAFETAEKLLAAVMETEQAQALAAEADARKQEIWNSQTTIVKSNEYVQGETYTGTAYYVSNNGDDSNDGLSPETPFATMERLNKIRFSFGDAVFFERGACGAKHSCLSLSVKRRVLRFPLMGKAKNRSSMGPPKTAAEQTIGNCTLTGRTAKKSGSTKTK